MNTATLLSGDKRNSVNEIINSFCNKIPLVTFFLLLISLLISICMVSIGYNTTRLIIPSIVLAAFGSGAWLCNHYPTNWSWKKSSLYWIGYFLPGIASNIIIGLCTVNHPWLHKKAEYQLVIDGVAINDDEVRFLNPLKHDIQKVPNDQSVQITSFATTKDGLPIRSLVIVSLRRADNPKLWKDPARYKTSLQKIVESRFKEICATTESTAISDEGLQMAFQLLDNGGISLRSMLPPNVQLNGSVSVQNTEVYLRE